MKTGKRIIMARRILFGTVLSLALAVAASAQAPIDDYTVEDGIIYYHDEPVKVADPNSFIILGFGYAKDYYNVYYQGQVLRYVDPMTFRLKNYKYPQEQDEGGESYLIPDGGMNGYVVTQNAVCYRGKAIEGANAFSFKVLTKGYALDAFNVYYRGKKIEDAHPSTFRVLEGGYAEDAFNTYFRGKKVSR